MQEYVFWYINNSKTRKQWTFSSVVAAAEAAAAPVRPEENTNGISELNNKRSFCLAQVLLPSHCCCFAEEKRRRMLLKWVKLSEILKMRWRCSRARCSHVHRVEMSVNFSLAFDSTHQTLIRLDRVGWRGGLVCHDIAWHVTVSAELWLEQRKMT